MSRRDVTTADMMNILLNLQRQIFVVVTERNAKKRLPKGALVTEEVEAMHKMTSVYNDILKQFSDGQRPTGASAASSSASSSRAQPAQSADESKIARAKEILQDKLAWQSLDANLRERLLQGKNSQALVALYQESITKLAGVLPTLQRCISTGVFGWGDGRDAYLLQPLNDMLNGLESPKDLVPVNEAAAGAASSTTMTTTAPPSPSKALVDQISAQISAQFNGKFDELAGKLDTAEAERAKAEKERDAAQAERDEASGQLVLVRRENAALSTKAGQLASQAEALAAAAQAHAKTVESLDTVNRTMYPTSGVLTRISPSGELYPDRYCPMPEGYYADNKAMKAALQSADRLDLYERYQLSKVINPAASALVSKLMELRKHASTDDHQHIDQLVHYVVANNHQYTIQQLWLTPEFYRTVGKLAAVQELDNFFEQFIRSGWYEDSFEGEKFRTNPHGQEQAKAMFSYCSKQSCGRYLPVLLKVSNGQVDADYQAALQAKVDKVFTDSHIATLNEVSANERRSTAGAVVPHQQAPIGGSATFSNAATTGGATTTTTSSVPTYTASPSDDEID